LKPSLLPLSLPFMANRKRLKASPQELLTLMDDYFTALYRDRHDPERPPELTHRDRCFISSANLGKLV
jgi:hypothetical protein